jgi:hypothetical protein
LSGGSWMSEGETDDVSFRSGLRAKACFTTAFVAGEPPWPTCQWLEQGLRVRALTGCRWASVFYFLLFNKYTTPSDRK